MHAVNHFLFFCRYVDHQTKLSGSPTITAEKEETTDVVMKQLKSPSPAMKALSDWVNTAESNLLSDHAVLADLAPMEEQLKRFQVSTFSPTKY